MSVVPLADADVSCGGKAHGLARLVRAGLPVPDGFVVTDAPADPRLVAAHLDRLGGGPVAVRSSGPAEDGGAASFAGQLETVLGVAGLPQVLAAIDRCASSGSGERVRSYRTHLGTHLGVPGGGAVPVVVQVLVEADRAGVLFTRDPRTGENSLVINASWGLGDSVVSGAVVPDEVVVDPTGAVVRHTVGTKRTRVDLAASGPVRTPVAEPDRARPCLTPDEIARLVDLGRRCEDHFGSAQDVEWAVRDGRLWVLQSRPVTTLAPGVVPRNRRPDAPPAVLTGVACSAGRAQGPARLVRSVDEFSRLRRGDVLVCRTTDPAWTPLFRVAAGVVAETGGVLCHAAIVAREYALPAVVGAADAMARLTDGELVVVDGDRGTVTSLAHRPGSS